MPVKGIETQEAPMPIETLIVVAAVATAFGFFAAMVALGDFTAGGN